VQSEGRGITFWSALIGVVLVYWPVYHREKSIHSINTTSHFQHFQSELRSVHTSDDFALLVCLEHVALTDDYHRGRRTICASELGGNVTASLPGASLQHASQRHLVLCHTKTIPDSYCDTVKQ